MNNVLDMTKRLLDKEIMQVIQDFENMTPEEQVILLEEYCNKYRELIKLEDVR